MKLLRLAACFILGLTIFTSCSVESEMHFNEDFGGTQLITMDMKGMMEMMEAMGQGGPGGMDEYTQFLNDPSLADSIANMEMKMNEEFAGTGASNFNMAFDEDGKVQFGFEFESLETFEKMKAKGQASGKGDMSEMLTEMGGGVPIVKGKWVTIPTLDNDAMKELMGEMGGDDMEADESMEMMQMMQGLMGGTIRMKTTYSFDRKIKKIKASVPYTQTDNKVVLDFTLEEIMKWTKEGREGDLRIKLK